jgi:hypothetical protein
MARTFLWIACAAALAGNVAAQDKPAADAPAKEKLTDYTTDFSAGTVSAGGIVGLTQSAIEEVQSSQDLVLALKPFSSGQSKTGYGIAVSPFRTALMPMAAKDYLYGGVKNRLLGQLTLSYAENTVQVAGADWRKSGFSADTSYYLDVKDDPIHYGAQAWQVGKCPEFDKLELKRAETEFADPSADLSDIEKKMLEARQACFNKAKNAARWNADRIQVSLGGGRIRREDGSRQESLGRSLTLGGLFSAGKQGALQVAYRRTSGEVDLTTLGGVAGHKSSRLTALRYTYGSEDGNGDTKVLAEISNAKDSEVTASQAVYKRALGFDKKVAKGTWLQFRVGKSRKFDGTSYETTALANLTFAPGAGLFK